MFQIKELLQKFKNIEDPRETKGKIALAINTALKSDLVKTKDVAYKGSGNIVRLNSHPAIRHKIMGSKELCLEYIKKILPGHIISDIR